MPTATLKLASLSKDKIDSAAGILYGCQLAKVGMVARFAGANGEATEIEITPTLIGQLAQLGKDRSIPAHFSHDYLSGDKDPIHSRVGAWKNVREDESGNLIGDLHLMPSQYKEAVLWLAENTPDGAGMSAVFDYNDLGNRRAYPLNFKAADVVSQGAATTAFFSKLTTDDMTKDETLALINESVPKLVTDAVTAALKDFKPAKSIDEDGVKGIVTAALKEHKPVIDEEALLVKAEARLASKIGTHGNNLGLGAGAKDDKVLPFVAIMSKHEEICKNRGKAILRAKSDNPKAYNEWVEAGRPEPQLAKA